MLKLTRDERKLFFETPNVVRNELLFYSISVISIMAPWYYMSRVSPYPVTISWLQMLIGTLFEFVLGEFSTEFPKYNVFPPVKLDFSNVSYFIPKYYLVEKFVAPELGFRPDDGSRQLTPC